jgi:hypothetical protein
MRIPRHPRPEYAVRPRRNAAIVRPPPRKGGRSNRRNSSRLNRHEPPIRTAGNRLRAPNVERSVRSAEGTGGLFRPHQGAIVVHFDIPLHLRPRSRSRASFRLAVYKSNRGDGQRGTLISL